MLLQDREPDQFEKLSKKHGVDFETKILPAEMVEPKF